MLEIYAYNAGKGDCIRLRFGDGHNVFIDTGVTRFGAKFKQLLNSILSSHETLDALILTHVDNDHIGGFLSFLRCGNKCPFHEVWMNHTVAGSLIQATLSTRENNEIYARLKAQGISVFPMLEGYRKEIGDAVFSVKNPRNDDVSESSHSKDATLAQRRDYRFSLTELAEKKIRMHDTSANNKSSIVFVFEYEGHRLLFTGDAWAEDVIKARGTFDLVKLPYHGSIGNVSDAYQQHFSSQNFLICADGNGHPDKQTIAKLEKWYGRINIFSPVAWWQNGYFVSDDKSHDIQYYRKDGLIISW